MKIYNNRQNPEKLTKKKKKETKQNKTKQNKTKTKKKGNKTFDSDLFSRENIVFLFSFGIALCRD